MLSRLVSWSFQYVRCVGVFKYVARWWLQSRPALTFSSKKKVSGYPLIPWTRYGHYHGGGCSACATWGDGQRLALGRSLDAFSSFERGRFISRSFIVSRESRSVTTVFQTLLIVIADTGQIIAHSLQNTQWPTKMRTVFSVGVVRRAIAPAGQTFPQRPHKIHFSGSIIGVPR